MQNKRIIKFNEAILEATDQLLAEDKNVYVIGLGVNEPKGIFKTTYGLKEKYGLKRVMDMPASENAMTGVIIGSAIQGLRPIMIHQRADFSLLGLDQLINNAAKWHHMFGGKMKAPIVIRIIIGKGWGQGCQHSQSLHSIYAHIPGIKVVMPSNPYDAKGLLIAATRDNNPVVYIDHRWLYNILGNVPEKMYEVEIGKAKVIKKGKDITILTISDGVLESQKALKILEKEGIDVEIIDLRSIKPLDKETIISSIKKTKRALIVDPDWKMCGLSSELMAFISEQAFGKLKIPPRRLTFAEIPCPTSWSLSNHFYYNEKDIAIEVFKIMEKNNQAQDLLEKNTKDKNFQPLDIPDATFVGPF